MQCAGVWKSKKKKKLQTVVCVHGVKSQYNRASLIRAAWDQVHKIIIRKCRITEKYVYFVYSI